MLTTYCILSTAFASQNNTRFCIHAVPFLRFALYKCLLAMGSSVAGTWEKTIMNRHTKRNCTLHKTLLFYVLAVVKRNGAELAVAQYLSVRNAVQQLDETLLPQDSLTRLRLLLDWFRISLCRSSIPGVCWCADVDTDELALQVVIKQAERKIADLASKPQYGAALLTVSLLTI